MLCFSSCAGCTAQGLHISKYPSKCFGYFLHGAFIDVPKLLMSLHQHHFCFLLAFMVRCCHPCYFFLLPFDAHCIQHTVWHQNFYVKFDLIVSTWACQNQCIAVASQFPSLLQSLGNTEEVEGTVWDKCHILHYSINNLHPLIVTNYTYSPYQCHGVSYPLLLLCPKFKWMTASTTCGNEEKFGWLLFLQPYNQRCP